MLSLSFVLFVFIVFFLFLLAHASPSPVAPLRTLQAELAASTRASNCHILRRRRISHARAALSRARLCRCPAFARAKALLAAARTATCPPRGRPPARIRADARVAAAAARVALGLPRPAYRALVLEPRTAPADGVVFMLHAAGGLATDMREFARFLRASGYLPGVRYVLPQAPVQFVRLFNATVPSWFNLLTASPTGPQAAGEIVRAAEGIEGMMKIQRRVWGIAPRRVMVVGRAQGGALAATVYLRYRVGAAVTLTGYLPIAETYPAALGEEMTDAPLKMFHGTKDEDVPIEIGRLSAKRIRGFGRRVVFVPFEGEGHDFGPRATRTVWEETAKFLALALRSRGRGD